MEFSRIYKENYCRIYAFAYRKLGSADDAADIAQETFTRMYEVVSTNSSIKQPRAWLYKVAANLSTNRLNSTNRRQRILRSRPSHVEHSASPEDRYIAGERLQQTRDALAQLSERDQTLLLLYQDKLSYAEMAEILGIKPTSVGKLLQRAIERLATKLKPVVEI
jgi:RNA polymerase sigma-70 factor (ECF subfamily)